LVAKAEAAAEVKSDRRERILVWQFCYFSTVAGFLPSSGAGEMYQIVIDSQQNTACSIGSREGMFSGSFIALLLQNFV